MKRVPYTYCIIRYVHDVAAGESLNIGVVLVAPELRFIGCKIDTRYARLSTAFLNFDGEQYRRVTQRLERAVARFVEADKPMQAFWDGPTDAHTLMGSIWADNGLSYQYGPLLSGITRDPAVALEDAYERMVESRYKKPKIEHKSDEDVFNKVYRAPLRRVKAFQALEPRTLSTDSINLTCTYTFLNGAVNVVQPLNFDYSREDQISAKAARWLGNAVSLQDSAEFGAIYYLLGRPQSTGLMPAYERAKRMLQRSPVKHKLVEEEEAEQFAESILEILQEHANGSGDDSKQTH